MFVTDHSAQIDAPTRIGAKEVSFWPTVELAFKDVWFMVEFCRTNGSGEEITKDVRTLLFDSFSGLQKFALTQEESGDRLLHVDVVTPDFVNRTHGWKIDRLYKVWTAIDPLDPVLRPFVYETQRGDRYSGSLLGTRVDDLFIESLIFELPNLSETNCGIRPRDTSIS